MPLKPFAVALGNPVEDNGEADDGEPIEKAEGKILIGYRLQNGLAKAFHTDH